MQNKIDAMKMAEHRLYAACSVLSNALIELELPADRTYPLPDLISLISADKECVYSTIRLIESMITELTHEQEKKEKEEKHADS